MKKISYLAIILCLSILLSCFVSCDNSTVTESDSSQETVVNIEPEAEVDLGKLSGKEAAELLLAQINLDDKMLQEEIVIDEKIELNIDWKSPFTALGAFAEGEGEIEGGGGSKTGCTYEGGVLEWSEFPLYSDENVEKEEQIDRLESSAAYCAELIKLIKDEVNVTDKWITYNDSRLLLSVEENSEMLLIENGKKFGGEMSDAIVVCRRYTNDGGQEVYEMYNTHFMDNVNGDPLYEMVSEGYFKYIDGYWYEFMENSSHKYAGENTYFSARTYVLEKTRGYWNFFIMSHSDSPTNAASGFHFINISYKESGIYKIDGGLNSLDDETWIPITYSVGTVDTDLLEYSPQFGGSLTINSNAFSNISSIRTESPIIQSQLNPDPNIQNPNVYCWDFEDDRVHVYEGSFYTYIDDVQIVLTDGKVIDKNKSTSVEEDKVGLHRIDTELMDDGIYNAKLAFVHNTFIESDVGIADFIAECEPEFERLGLQFNDTDMDISNMITEAQIIGTYFKENLEWNGYHLNKMEDISLAFSAQYELQATLHDRYLSMKDNEDANLKDYPSDFLDKIGFADIIEMGVTNVSINDNRIRVEGLYAKLPTFANLLDDGQEYVIKLGLCYTEEDGSLSNRVVSLLASKETPVAFVEGEGCTVSADNTSYLIPGYIVHGRCALVVYVATADDGIRVSKLIKLTGSFGSGTIADEKGIVEYETVDGCLFITYKEPPMRHVDVSDLHSLSIKLIREALIKNAVFFGSLPVNPVMEYSKAVDGTGTAVNDKDRLSAGVYRMAFSSALHDDQVIYVYCTITEEMLTSQE